MNDSFTGGAAYPRTGLSCSSLTQACKNVAGWHRRTQCSSLSTLLVCLLRATCLLQAHINHARPFELQDE